jgi:hypothetical protein
MPRFVLLYHDCPPGYERPSHWDLMLEADGKLRTWTLFRLPAAWRSAQEQTALTHPTCPSLAEGNSIAAERLPDHRIDYLKIEGPIGENRGEVRRIDEGTYESSRQSAEQWEIELSGRLIDGAVILSATRCIAG